MKEKCVKVKEVREENFYGETFLEYFLSPHL
jgi:hypothetical protein